MSVACAAGCGRLFARPEDMQNHLRGKKDALHVSYVQKNPTACGALTTATALAERREAEQLKAAEQQRQQQAARQRQQEVVRQRQMEAERQRQEKEAEIRRQREAETRLMEQAQAALDALPVRRGDLAHGRKQADLCNWAKAQLEAGVFFQRAPQNAQPRQGSAAQALPISVNAPAGRSLR